MAKGLVFGGLNGGSGSNIKSIQYGQITTSTTPSPIDQTITAVDLTKSILISKHASGVDSTQYSLMRGELTASNKARFTISYASFGAGNIEWTVIEFNNVKSKQSGTITFSGNNVDQIYSITQVDPAKSLLVYSFSASGGTTIKDTSVAGNFAGTGNQIRFTQRGGALTYTIHYQIIEFK